MNPPIDITVIVLNYNGRLWLDRCLDSLQRQTWLRRTEVLVVDNQSTDGSDRLAEARMRDWKNGSYVSSGANLGYCAGNNLGASLARGEFLFFLNNDAWLEDDCLEQLLKGALEMGADAANPWIMDYEDDAFQSSGARGFDLLGFSADRSPVRGAEEVFMPEGCAYFIRRSLFERLGGFDEGFFMYCDELDLSLRLWIAGGSAVAIPRARLHHRGAAQVNPAGKGRMVEIRTSVAKRYYTNRNGLWTLLKSGQDLLLALAFLQALYLLMEGLGLSLLLGRRDLFTQAYWKAVGDCWRNRSGIVAQRRRIARLRQRDDLWMLRFLKWRFNRWDEFQRSRKFGMPRLNPSQTHSVVHAERLRASTKRRKSLDGA